MPQDELKPQVTTNVAIDARGFVRVSGVCIGRRVHVGEAAYFEVKDRNRNRALSRGAQFIRVPLDKFLADLAE